MDCTTFDVTINSLYIVANISESSSLQYHFRLGHASLKSISKLFPSTRSLSKLECTTCQLGKHFRTTFVSRENKCCNSLFGVIHTDIWGSTRIKTVSSHSYFLTFIV